MHQFSFLCYLSQNFQKQNDLKKLERSIFHIKEMEEAIKRKILHEKQNDEEIH